MSITRLRFKEPKKQETEKKVIAFGGPPERKRWMVVRAPYDKAFKGDLEWAANFIKARLREIDLLFQEARYNRPQENRSSTYYERELFAEENGLKGILQDVDHQLPLAALAHDDERRKARLDAFVDEQIEQRLFTCRKFESQGEFRDAKLYRLEMPKLRIEMRQQFFRY